MYSITQVGISEITSIIQMDVSSIYSLRHSYYTGERSREREMDERLYEAAITGDVSSLSSLLREDPNILDRVLVGEAGKETPLHIAAQFGRVKFVEEILQEKPEFAGQLNSQGRTPLHVASAKGHTQVVKALLEKDKQACFVRDRDGMIPLHLAAIKGRVEALKELVKSKEATILMATDGGEPLLNLCLKHDQFEAVKTLIEIAGNDTEFMSLTDEDENTVLHLLAAKGQYKIIKLLFPDDENAKGLDVNAMNVNGSTPLDLVREVPGRWNRTKIGMVFRGVKAKRARELPGKTRNQFQNGSLKASVDKSHEWTHKSRDTLMVVAILIATVTFQAMMTPPGGVWQQDECFNLTSDPYSAGRSIRKKVDCNGNEHDLVYHKAGNAIMCDEYFEVYVIFVISNSIGFVHSILLILLLLCGFSFKRKRLTQYLRLIIWICVISMFITYWCSFFTQRTHFHFRVPLFGMGILFLGCGLSTLLLFIAYLFKRLYRYLHKIGIVHFFWRTTFGVKKGSVPSLKFLWNKVVQNKMTSAPKEDPHHELVP